MRRAARMPWWTVGGSLHFAATTISVWPIIYPSSQAARQAAERWGVGSGASHVVSGHLWPHAELEERLAAFVEREQALYFTTGYMANLAHCAHTDEAQ
jgi:hypothetical protein